MNTYIILFSISTFWFNLSVVGGILFLQDPFDKVTYSLDGDVSALDYFTVNTAGQIYTDSTRSVATDTFQPMQYIVSYKLHNLPM